MDTFITNFGWGALVFCLIGLLASALSYTYYLGYKKGGGEWRGKLFEPKPIQPSYDIDIVMEVKMLREKLRVERSEVLRLRKQVERQYEELHNGKKMPAPRKRKPVLKETNIYAP